MIDYDSLYIEDLKIEIKRMRKLINAALSWRQSWPDAEDEQWARDGVKDSVCNLIRACDEYKNIGGTE